ncbi:MAG: hypothetical protein HY327_04640 [Chloroflexi bacterium]|nr:hypothetical protein [Chloroflexota bacterium]
MRKTYFAFNLIAIALLAALVLSAVEGCAPTVSQNPTSTSAPSVAVTSTFNPAEPTLVAPSGYRPVQAGDLVEGMHIGYQYILPSLQTPLVTAAFNENLQSFLFIKPEMNDELIAYFRELGGVARDIYAFDEDKAGQKEPQPVKIEANKPVEYVIIPLPDDDRAWSVTETQEGQIRTAYKLVRRKDGGLRFVDAYDKVALTAMRAINTTHNGTGAGLLFSSRLALLKLFLTDEKYQRGTDVIVRFPPDVKDYDARILKIDPSQQGLNRNQEWAIVSRPGAIPLGAPP